MLNAQKDYLNNFFQGDKRFIIPFFQRPYVWEKENWEILWENLQSIIENDNQNKEHFIGTLIIKQKKAEILGDHAYDLIDGQQRLTTIALILKALADTCQGELTNLRGMLNSLIRFEDAHNKTFLRIEHNRTDMPHFGSIMLENIVNDGDENRNSVIKAYKFFREKVESFSDTQRDHLRKVILSRVPVISMLLSENDDEQEIFDTLNSLGVKLTTAELLKNHLFKEDEIQDMYDEYWFNMFEADDERAEYWNRDKTAGRVIRTNVEVLLYCYLIIENLKEVKLEKLYQEYKNWLKGKVLVDRINFLKKLTGYAEIYFKLPDGEELNEISFNEDEKRFFQVIQNLQITTAYPLILYIYHEVERKEDRLSFLRIIESYLVRRNLCRLTTKNYNNLFISILQKMKEKQQDGNLTPELLKKILIDFGDTTNSFPNDVEFKKAFHDSALPNYNARIILYCLALFQKKSGKNDVQKLSLNSFSVEHIMPKKWEIYWQEPKYTKEQKYNRYMVLKTMGNLTLITQRLNSAMQNAGWKKKKDTLKQYSSLQITTAYLEREKWNEKEIEIRANDLAELAISIWKRE